MKIRLSFFCKETSHLFSTPLARVCCVVSTYALQLSTHAVLFISLSIVYIKVRHFNPATLYSVYTHRQLKWKVEKLRSFFKLQLGLSVILPAPSPFIGGAGQTSPIQRWFCLLPAKALQSNHSYWAHHSSSKRKELWKTKL